jgi:hypothetical protein
MLAMVLVFIGTTCNVRSMCRSLSLTTEARKLSKYKLGLVIVQEIRWDKVGAELIKEGSKAIRYEIHKHVNSNWNKKKLRELW